LRLLLILALTLGAIFSFNAIFPIIYLTRIRYFLIAMPLLMVLFAYCLLVLPRGPLLALAFLGLWCIGGYHIWLQAENWPYGARQTLLLQHPPLHRYSDALQFKTRPQDRLLGFSKSGMVNWRLKHGWTTVDYYTKVALGIDGAFIPAALSGSDLRADYEKHIGAAPYLLLAYEPQDPPANLAAARAWLEAEHRACELVVDSAELHVRRYVDRTLACDRAYAPIHYDNGITIVDKFADYDPAAQTVRVVTGWGVADEAQLQAYNVSLQILSPDWRLLAQSDRHLYDDVLKWYAAELPTAALPPGDYRLVVIVYDRYSGEKVSGVDISSGEVGAILPILHLKIER